MNLRLILLLLGLFVAALESGRACRVGSEKLKIFTKRSLERLLDPESLESIYWPEEPLDSEALSKATGINITIAQTEFNRNQVGSSSDVVKNDIAKPTLLYDFFVTCSTDRDRSYILTINLELDSPFKVIELHYELTDGGQEEGSFKVLLPQSTFLVQLNQRIRYDECLSIKHVQLAPNVSYEIECSGCNERQKRLLDRMFKKRMTQLDAELDSMLSEKLLLGLQALLNQQRLDLELYMN